MVACKVLDNNALKENIWVKTQGRHEIKVQGRPVLRLVPQVVILYVYDEQNGNYGVFSSDYEGDSDSDKCKLNLCFLDDDLCRAISHIYLQVKERRDTERSSSGPAQNRKASKQALSRAPSTRRWLHFGHLNQFQSHG